MNGSEDILEDFEVGWEFYNDSSSLWNLTIDVSSDKIITFDGETIIEWDDPEIAKKWNLFQLETDIDNEIVSILLNDEYITTRSINTNKINKIHTKVGGNENTEFTGFIDSLTWDWENGHYWERDSMKHNCTLHTTTFGEERIMSTPIQDDKLGNCLAVTSKGESPNVAYGTMFEAVKDRGDSHDRTGLFPFETYQYEFVIRTNASQLQVGPINEYDSQYNIDLDNTANEIYQIYQISNFNETVDYEVQNFTDYVVQSYSRDYSYDSVECAEVWIHTKYDSPSENYLEIHAISSNYYMDKFLRNRTNHNDYLIQNVTFVRNKTMQYYEVNQTIDMFDNKTWRPSTKNPCLSEDISGDEATMNKPFILRNRTYYANMIHLNTRYNLGYNFSEIDNSLSIFGTVGPDGHYFNLHEEDSPMPEFYFYETEEDQIDFWLLNDTGFSIDYNIDDEGLLFEITITENHFQFWAPEAGIYIENDIVRNEEYWISGSSDAFATWFIGDEDAYDNPNSKIDNLNDLEYQSIITDSIFMEPSLPSSGSHYYLWRRLRDMEYGIIHDQCNTYRGGMDYTWMELTWEVWNWKDSYAYGEPGCYYTGLYYDVEYLTNNTIIGWETFNITAEIEVETFSKYWDNDHNFTVILDLDWEVWIIEEEESIFNFILKLLIPFLTFFLFPFVFTKISKKKSLIPFALGCIVGFVIMGFLGYMDFVSATVLATLSSLGFFLVHKKMESRGESEY
jgi:hypothetical protein